MIHKYQNNGYNIVLDVNSGAVHVVDQEAYDVIEVLNRMNEDHTVETLKSPETAEALKKELGEKYSEKDLLDILEAVTELTEQGRLFTKDIYVFILHMTVTLPVSTALRKRENITAAEL